MKTYRAICLKDEIFTDGNHSLALKRGTEYIISPISANETVTVFSSCWASGVSASLFGGLVPGPGDSHEPPNSENQGAGEHISQQAKECHTAGQGE